MLAPDHAICQVRNRLQLMLTISPNCAWTSVASAEASAASPKWSRPVAPEKALNISSIQYRVRLWRRRHWLKCIAGEEGVVRITLTE